MLSSRSFIVSGLMFRSLIHLSLFLCVVLESVLVSFFYKWLTLFPAPLVKQIVFSPLYILDSFVKDKVSTNAWIYLWAFYFIPLIYISVYVPAPYCLDDCSFVVEPEVRQLISPIPFFFLKIALAILGFLYFHTNLEIICSNSVKNTVGSLIGIALNL